MQHPRLRHRLHNPKNDPVDLNRSKGQETALDHQFSHQTNNPAII